MMHRTLPVLSFMLVIFHVITFSLIAKLVPAYPASLAVLRVAVYLLMIVLAGIMITVRVMIATLLMETVLISTMRSMRRPVSTWDLEL